MAQLSDDEAKQLEALLAKKDAPEAPAPSHSRNIDVYVDLSDEKAVERALRLGILEPKDVEDAGGDGDGDAGGKGGKGKKKGGDGGDGDGDDGDETPPRRKGYFQ